MRNGHHQNNNHKRMRGRHQHQNNNNRKGQNPLTRAYESNGPDVKIRGTASTIAEKYIQLARDAQSSGDPVAAENYYQHAEHYFRLIAAAQEQFRQQNPQHFNPQQPSQGNPSQGGQSDDNFDDSDDEFQSASGQNEPYAREQPQPFIPRDAQPSPPREQQTHRPHQTSPRNQGNQSFNQNQPQPVINESVQEVSSLPSFITGAQPQLTPSAQPGADQNAQPELGLSDDRNGDRFPLHRRRRRHRGNRPEFGAAQGSSEAGGEPPRDPVE